MARTYKVYLVQPIDPSGGPLTIEADDVELTGDNPNTSSDYNFLRFPSKVDDELISVARVPFEMVKAIIS